MQGEIRTDTIYTKQQLASLLDVSIARLDACLRDLGIVCFGECHDAPQISGMVYHRAVTRYQLQREAENHQDGVPDAPLFWMKAHDIQDIA